MEGRESFLAGIASVVSSLGDERKVAATEPAEEQAEEEADDDATDKATKFALMS